MCTFLMIIARIWIKQFIKCIFVGCSNESKAYKCYDLIFSKMHINWDVIFNEGGTYTKYLDASNINLEFEDSISTDLTYPMQPYHPHFPNPSMDPTLSKRRIAQDHPQYQMLDEDFTKTVTQQWSRGLTISPTILWCHLHSLSLPTSKKQQ